MSSDWEGFAGPDYQLYIRREKTMTEKMSMRRYHLSSIKEWLKLCKTPLRGAQRQTADVLKIHHHSNNLSALVSVSDLAQAINTSLTWAMHAIDLVLALEGGEELTPEKIAKLVQDTSATHQCPQCGYEYTGNFDIEPGNKCWYCGQGLVEPIVKPIESVPTPCYVCSFCETQYTSETSVKAGDTCSACGVGCIEFIVKPLKFEPSADYVCDYCAEVYHLDGNLKVGDACIYCDDGSIAVAIPF